MPRRRRAPAPGKPEASSPPVTIDVLTADDLQCVFSLLTAHGLSCAIAVCKSWAAVEERTRELIWQNLVERQFPGSEAGAAFMLCSSARSRFRLLARDPNADEGARSRGQRTAERGGE